jgi:hypothetical protein
LHHYLDNNPEENDNKQWTVEIVQSLTENIKVVQYHHQDKSKVANQYFNFVVFCHYFICFN